MNVPTLVQDRRQLLAFARVLAGYGCASDDDIGLCGNCSPCEARQWLEDRQLLTPPARRPLSDRESELLRKMPRDGSKVRPMDVGGRDGNDVSRVLMSLVRKGYAEVSRRAGHCRPSYLYRRVDAA